MPRKLTKPRPPQGKHLSDLRKAAGLSQYDLAKALDIPQQNIAYWEQSEKPPRSDVLPEMANALGVKISDLIFQNYSQVAISKGNKPIGKVKQLFDEVSKLPRRQQEKIVEFISAFVQQYHMSKK